MQFGKQVEEQVKVVVKPAVTLPVQEICTVVTAPVTPERMERLVWLYQMMNEVDIPVRGTQYQYLSNVGQNIESENKIIYTPLLHYITIRLLNLE